MFSFFLKYLVLHLPLFFSVGSLILKDETVEQDRLVYSKVSLEKGVKVLLCLPLWDGPCCPPSPFSNCIPF